jgi:hypothetical protein
MCGPARRMNVHGLHRLPPIRKFILSIVTRNIAYKTVVDNYGHVPQQRGLAWILSTTANSLLKTVSPRLRLYVDFLRITISAVPLCISK